MTYSIPADSERLVRDFQHVIRNINGKTLKGLLVAGAIVKAESMRLTPVLTGNLKSSHFIEHNQNPDKPEVAVGTTASYGIYVHENLEAYHHNGQAKFLATAIINKRKEIVDAVTRHAKV